MKKFMTLFLVLSMVFTLASCNTSGECNHSFGSWMITKQATCTNEGVQSRNCMKCGYLDSQSVAPIGHTDVVDPAKAATCTETGLTEGSHCNVCNATIIAQQPIPMLNHIETVDPAKTPGCTENGLTEGKHCSVCNSVIVAQTEIPAIGHSYTQQILTEASCQSSGLAQMNCSNCNDHYTTPINLNIYTATEIYNLYKNSIGEILTYDKSGQPYAIGTGFVYAADGKIVTNYHVIEDSVAAEITIGNSTYQVQSVLAYDETIDIAVLQINATGLQALPICTLNHAVGQPVYAFGSSKGLTDTFSQGIITYAQRKLDGVTYVQHDAAISGGNSGGPLINQYGEIIGINTWTVQDSQNLNFAISVTELKNLRYGTPVTLEELFGGDDSEVLFDALALYVMLEGDYNEDSEEYELEIGYDEDDGTAFSRILYYVPESDVLQFSLWVDSDYLIYVELDAIDGSYEWFYADYEDIMIGTIDATKFNSNSKLIYTDYEITSTYSVSDVRAFAEIMMQALLSSLSEDLFELGLSATDIGFVNY